MNYTEKNIFKSPLPGVTETTQPVLDVFSEYKELNRYYLVGGTALAIRNPTRLSEDLDFFFYNPYPGKKQPLPDFDNIRSKIAKDFSDVNYLAGDKFSNTLIINDVKVQFHSEYRFKRARDFDRLGHIRIPSEQSLIGMKVIALHLRNAWRDVYDLYALKQKYDLPTFYQGYDEIMSKSYCGSESSKKALFKNTLIKLTDEKFLKDLDQKDNIGHLRPAFNLEPDQVADEFKTFLEDIALFGD